MKISTKVDILVELKMANDLLKNTYAFPEVGDGDSTNVCRKLLEINEHIQEAIRLMNLEGTR